MKLLVISPTANPVYAERMIATARRVGIEPMLYGFNSNHPHGKDYQGTDIVEILRTRVDAEYVMGVDAPDIAFLEGEDAILHKLKCLFDDSMVVSAEMDGVKGIELTQEEMYRQCMEDGGCMPQMNIGGWIGKREYVLDAFATAERLYAGRAENPDYSYDNHFQHLALMKAWGRKRHDEAPEQVRHLCGLGGIEFHVDWHCHIFQSMNKAKVEMVRDALGNVRVFNPHSNTWPSVLHYNGDPTRGAYNEMVKEILK